MREHEAFALAKQRANATGECWFVVTNAAYPGYDYDVVSLAMGKTVEVVGVVEPDQLADIPDEPAANRIARTELTCRGCSRPKSSLGQIVCWDCFKRHHASPFKYAKLPDLNDWLASIGRADQQIRVEKAG